MFKKILLFWIILLFWYNNAFSYNQTELKIFYDKFYENVSKKTKTNNEKLIVLNKLNNNLNLFLNKTKNKKNIEILSYFVKLNNNEILKLNQTSYQTVNVTKKYDKNKKYLLSELKNIFSNYIDLDNPYLLKSWYYSTYKFNDYIFLKNISWVYLSDLEYNNIDLQKTLLIKNKDEYYFSNNYSFIKLVKKDLIENITNKNEFLFNLNDDNKFLIDDYNQILFQIKNQTQEIIKNSQTQEEKIQLIYKYIIENIDYYENYSDWNKQIFSWVLTFKNKIWVCDWYTKLFLYMLSFAWIENVEIKRWFVIDSESFPTFWHAWVKIWDKYYDPTFDDPIWWNNSDKINFMYFWIPYWLMYVNRFDWITILNDLDKLSLEDRKKIVLKNMYDIYDTYKNYELLKKIKNKINLWLEFDENLTIEKLSNKIEFFEVKNHSYQNKNWNLYKIKSINFYSINDENIENIIFNPNIDISKMTLFKWYNEDWNFEYRLSYDIINY